MKQTLSMKPSQQQKMTQRQIQSLHILMMDNYELHEFLQNEYMENPMFEYNSSGAPTSAKSTVKQNEGDSLSCEPAAADGDFLLRHFLEQLDSARYTNSEWNTFKFMILLLDEQGFFPYSPSDLYHTFHISIPQAEKCLKALQSLEPAGVFQPGLKNYLLYQLQSSGQDTPRMINLIQHHLENIAAGNFRTIADDFHTDIPSVKRLVRQLKSLSPTPLAGLGQDANTYITPDILAVYQDGAWNVALNDNWIGSYSLSDYYLRMMQQTAEPDLKIYFQEKYERGRFVIQRIEQRRATILAICGAIIKRQENFFLGRGSLAPMTLADIAEDLNLAISTVSRGIKNKYLQYPHGTILLKTLFTSGVARNDTESISSSNVICLMKDIIRSENKKKPYSDNKLAELLKEQGVQISRRTVAKYRLMAGIPSTLERKEEKQ